MRKEQQAMVEISMQKNPEGGVNIKIRPNEAGWVKLDMLVAKRSVALNHPMNTGDIIMEGLRAEQLLANGELYIREDFDAAQLISV